MERRAFQTPLGEVWLWGDEAGFSGSGPLVVVIGGAFQAERNILFQLSGRLNGAGLLFGHLPGNHCPTLSEVSVAAFASAYDRALDLTAPGRPLVLCGVSTGALVALAMRSPKVGRLLLLDPPLATSKLWPLVPIYRAIMANHPGGWAQAFIQTVLGVFPGHVEERGYTSLLDALPAPAVAILGAEPLMPARPLSETPSLVDEPERALLREVARVIEVPNAGHKLAMPPIHTALRLLIGDLAGA